MEPQITPAMAKRIEFWRLDRLVPFARNARTHSDEQVAQIAASIAAFGFNNPILVDSNAGIIAGHGRLLAARKLGLEEVPVIVLDHLSETQKRAYIIWLTTGSAELAGWDEDLLAANSRNCGPRELELERWASPKTRFAKLLADTDRRPRLPRRRARSRRRPSIR